MAFDDAAIRKRIDGMLDAFSTSAGFMFEATGPRSIREYQKGLYGLRFVKPSKPIRRLLAVDREILLLATSYSDLQPRVNKLAIEIIDGSDGRLERTVAIVIHKDPLGDGKLRNWGRDVGLTVIPLFMAGDTLPSGDVLERKLLSEFFTHDPFDVTGPVSDNSQFFGRRDEAQELARQLQQGQVRACLGIRKSGKTSILHRVLAALQDYHDCYTAVVDCSRDAIWAMNASQLLFSIAAAAEASLREQDFSAEVKPTSESCSMKDASDRLIGAMKNCPGTLVLMFDEVDYITPGSPTAPHWRAEFNTFWRNLRAAYQEIARTDKRLSVFASGVSSKWFREEAIDQVENAALAFLPEEYLAPLSRGASISMIQEIGRTSGLVFSDDAAATLADAAGYVPFWIRKAGSFVHRNTPIERRPLRFESDYTKVLAASFIESEGASIAEVALTHLFRVYPELRPVAKACLAGDASSFSKPHVVALYKYGLLRTPSFYPELAGPMMTSGLDLALREADAVIHPHDVRNRSDTVVQFTDMGEWAEELALVGKQRNVLERRLRGMAVNFIRADAIADRQKGTVSDRILRAVPTAQRAKLKHLTPEELIEKFTWKELIALFEHEWALFNALFNDKAQFQRHGETINDRLDAHAKNADRADLALQRKALAWFEDALARA